MNRFQRCEQLNMPKDLVNIVEKYHTGKKVILNTNPFGLPGDISQNYVENFRKFSWRNTYKQCCEIFGTNYLKGHKVIDYPTDSRPFHAPIYTCYIYVDSILMSLYENLRDIVTFDDFKANYFYVVVHCGEWDLSDDMLVARIRKMIEADKEKK